MSSCGLQSSVSHSLSNKHFLSKRRWQGIRGGCLRGRKLAKCARRLFLLSCGLALLRASAADGDTVALFVDGKFHQELEPEIARLAADIAGDLSVSTVVDVVDGDSIQAVAIRSRLKDLYATRGLIGTVLIGDVPTAYSGDYPTPGANVFATDGYYEDLDDYCWLDPDGNGIFNQMVDADGDGDFDWFLKVWIAEHNREVWSGRLLPPKSAGFTDRVNMLRSYLGRNHAYRTGLRTYMRGMVYAESVRHNGDTTDGEDDQETIYARALAIMDESWLFSRSAGDVLDFVWSDDLGQHMNLWLADVHQPYEYGVVNVHGLTTAQWFGQTNWLYSADYQATPANTLLVDLASCNNGCFTDPDYLGGWVLFAGGALVVRANTWPVFQVGSLQPDVDLRLLSLGLTVGETRLADLLSNDAGVLLGDPTLRLRPHTAHSAGLVADRGVVVIPPDPAYGLPAGLAGSAVVRITNNGAAPLTLYHRYTTVPSLDHRYPAGGELQSQFRLGRLFPVTFQPGQGRNIVVQFWHDGQSGAGTYRSALLFYTDSPATPYLWIGAEKTLYASRISTIRRDSGGTVLIQAEGIPGRANQVEASLDLVTWNDIGTALEDPTGTFTFEDHQAIALPTRFYRLRAE